jgi:putative membrane protein
MERKIDKNSNINYILKKYYKEIILYFFLLFGGLWQILGLFTELSNLFAQYLIILISIFTFTEFFVKSKEERKQLVSYSIIIILSGFTLELIGHDTGFVFGEYQYGPILDLKIGGVPIAIGFAWLSTLLASFAILQRTKLYPLLTGRNFWKAFFVGFFMMLFDAFMEPASIKLNYWSWEIGIVPLQNYFAWFVFGTLFAYVGFKMKVFIRLSPKFAVHVYIAQLIFFIMIYFS